MSGNSADNLKVCYLVPGYTPTPEKEEILFSLLSKLKADGKPIILVQHNITPTRIQELVDYVILDKNNDLLNFYPKNKKSDFKCVVYYDFFLSNSLQISTQYLSGVIYHGISALSLFFRGLHFAKSIGSDICHLIEYDTEIHSLDEFHENEILLKENGYSSIHYHISDHDLHMIHCQVSSFNLNSYSFEELDWSKKRSEAIEILETDRYGIANGMAEVAFYELLHSNKNSLAKDNKILADKQIRLDLSSTIESDSVISIPYVSDDNESVNVCVFYQSKTKEGFRNLKFVVNGNEVNSEIHNQGDWFIFPVGHINDLNHIQFYVDGELVQNYNFVDEIDKTHFMNNSRLINL